MYKSINVHLGQDQDMIMSIQIYLEYKYTYENDGFCILCIGWLQNIKNFQETFEICHDFPSRNVTGGTPHPKTSI